MQLLMSSSSIPLDWTCAYHCAHTLLLWAWTEIRLNKSTFFIDNSKLKKKLNEPCHISVLMVTWYSITGQWSNSMDRLWYNGHRNRYWHLIERRQHALAHFHLIRISTLFCVCVCVLLNRSNNLWSIFGVRPYNKHVPALWTHWTLPIIDDLNCCFLAPFEIRKKEEEKYTERERKNKIMTRAKTSQIKRAHHWQSAYHTLSVLKAADIYILCMAVFFLFIYSLPVPALAFFRFNEKAKDFPRETTTAAHKKITFYV